MNDHDNAGNGAPLNEAQTPVAPEWSAAEARQLGGQTHPGCNYLAIDFCNKCGWVREAGQAEAVCLTHGTKPCAHDPHAFEYTAARPGDCRICHMGDEDPRHQQHRHVPSLSLALPLPAGYAWCWRCQAAKLPHAHEDGE